MSAAHDFDLYGFVGIRVIGASARELSAVRRQIGPLDAPLSRDPDLTIRFVRDLGAGEPLRILGARDAGYTDEAYIVLRGLAQAPIKMSVPFGEIGGRVEISVERGAGGIPFLVHLINMAALGRGVVPIHASAFIHRGKTVLVTGWAKGGKTELLLAFAANGAEYVGDEWVYVEPSTRTAVGIPEPIRLWDWQLASMPAVRRSLSLGARAKLRTLRTATGISEPLLASTRTRRGPVGSLIRRATELIERQRSVQAPPQTLFGAAAIARPVTIERLVHVTSHELDSVLLQRVDAIEVAARMTQSLLFEWAPIRQEYLRFRHAFPHKQNPLFDGDMGVGPLLTAALSPLPAVELRHPYPVDIPALYPPVAEWLEQG